MAATVKVMRLDIYENDFVGPLKCDIYLEISDDAISVDAASAGAGKVLKGRVPRNRWNTLLANSVRVKGEKLPGVLDALCVIPEEP